MITSGDARSSHQQTIVFKVMLTDPRRYTVRPNYALLAPGQSTSVKVTLRALPNAEEALQQLLTSRQALLFKWRAVNADVLDTSESSEASPFQEENPAALFIESTSPVLEQKMKVAFKRVEVTDDAPEASSPGPLLISTANEPVESRATTATTDLLDVTPLRSYLLAFASRSSCCCLHSKLCSINSRRRKLRRKRRSAQHQMAPAPPHRLLQPPGGGDHRLGAAGAPPRHLRRLRRWRLCPSGVTLYLQLFCFLFHCVQNCLLINHHHHHHNCTNKIA